MRRTAWTVPLATTVRGQVMSYLMDSVMRASGVVGRHGVPDPLTQAISYLLVEI